MSALAKDPEHRYQSADDLRADLLRFRRGRPLAAAPVTAIVAEVPTAAVTNAGIGRVRGDGHGREPARPGRPDRRSTPQPRRRRHPATFTILTLLVLAALVGGILFAATKLGGNQVTVAVPDVVGKTEAPGDPRARRRSTSSPSPRSQQRQAGRHGDRAGPEEGHAASRRTRRSRSA